MRSHALGLVKRLLLSILVLSAPFLYVGFSYLRQRTARMDKKPFVHWSGLDPHSEVFVTWETSEATSSAVTYGTDPNRRDLRVEDAERKTLHRCHLTGLSPDTRYYYQACPAAGADPDQSFAVQSFKTAPYGARAFNVTLISDTQQVLGIGFYDTVASAISRNLDTSFLVNAGDLTQEAEDQASWNLYFKESIYLDRIPLVPCPGNHESIDSPGSLYIKYFGITENERDVFYSFDWGNAQFIIAQIGSRSHVDPAIPRNEIPFKWLAETLEAGQDKDYRILIYHINRIEIMAPLVERYNVSLAVHGHAHSYSRYMVNGHTYVCLGNGATLQDGEIRRETNVQKRTNGAGFTRLTIDPVGIRLETFTPGMDRMDDVFLRRDSATGLLTPDDLMTY